MTGVDALVAYPVGCQMAADARAMRVDTSWTPAGVHPVSKTIEIDDKSLISWEVWWCPKRAAKPWTPGGVQAVSRRPTKSPESRVIAVFLAWTPFWTPWTQSGEVCRGWCPGIIYLDYQTLPDRPRVRGRSGHRINLEPDGDRLSMGQPRGDLDAGYKSYRRYDLLDAEQRSGGSDHTPGHLVEIEGLRHLGRGLRATWARLPQTKLTPEIVAIIKASRGSAPEIAGRLNLKRQTVRDIIAGRTWKSIQASVVALFVLVSGPAHPHEWYQGLRSPDGQLCCNGRDCAPATTCIRDGKVGVMALGRCQLPGVDFPIGRVLPQSSPDGLDHSCVWGGEVKCLIQGGGV